MALHGTSIHNNSASRLLKELGVLDKLELVALPEVYRLKTPKLDISVPQKDPEAYIKMLAGHFPSEADGIQGFISYMIGLADETDKISRNKGKFVRALFPLQFPKMWNVRNKTLSDLLSNYIEDNELKSDKTTFMPSIIHRSTRLRPMSLAAPVITATLFLNSFI